jgi:hypothetical protein
VGDSEHGRLEPQSIIRRAEKLLAQSERIALTAEQAEDSRLALMAIDRAQKSLDSLAKIHGMIGPDQQVVIDQRQVNVYADWSTDALQALEDFHKVLASGGSVSDALDAVKASQKALPRPREGD